MNRPTGNDDSFATRDSSASPSNDRTETLHQGDSKTGRKSGGLEVRCPSCHTPMDVASDTTLTDLTCTACGSHFSLIDHAEPTHMAPSLTRMGRFELIERLGVGGFGSVWKARDKELDRTVAIKIPRAGAMTAEEQEKFFREARAAAQLRHPSIVSVHEVGRDGDSVYIVSDFVRGVTLGDWLTGQQLTSREAAELCAKIADALHHAHEQGVVHRDLKPANIMIDGDGQPHLMDFGLARREVGEVTVTMDGQVLGTPAYMSPEQAQGEAHTADRRSDVYSLGVILFQLLTGERPFRGNARMLMHQVIHDEPPSPRKLNANVQKDLETITLKCLEKDPAKRYQTAHYLADEIRRFLLGQTIHSRPVNRLARVWRWCRRYPQVASLSAALLTVLATLAVVGPSIAVRQTTLRIHAGELLAANQQALSRLDRQNAELQSQAIRNLIARATVECEAGRIRNGVAFCVSAIERAGTDNPLRTLAESLVTSWTPSLGKIMVHDSYVGNAVFEPNGETILTSSGPNVWQWDPKTLRPIGPPLHHDSLVYGFIVSPAKSRLAVFLLNSDKSNDDRFQIHLWNLENAKPMGKSLPHTGSVFTAAFTPDGSSLLTGCSDGTARLWDAATGQLLRDLTQNKENSDADAGDALVANSDKSPQDAIVAVAINPNGSSALTISQRLVVRRWDVNTGALLGEHLHIDGANSPFSRIAISPDMEKLFVGMRGEAFSETFGGGGRNARLWDVATGKPFGAAMRSDYHTGNSYRSGSGVAFSPDGAMVATAGHEGDFVWLWDAKTGEPKGRPLYHDGSAEVAFSDARGGKPMVITGSWSGTAQLWDAESGRASFKPLHHDSQVTAVAFSLGSSIALTGSFDGTARLWSISGGGWKSMQMGSNITIGGSEGRIQSGLTWGYFDHGIVGVQPDGRTALSMSSVREQPKADSAPIDRTAIQLHDARTGEDIGEPFNVDGKVVAAVIGQEGPLVLTTNDQAAVQLWNAHGARPLDKVQPRDKSKSYLSPIIATFNRNGRRLLIGPRPIAPHMQSPGETANVNQPLRLWDTMSAKPLGQPWHHPEPIGILALAPDGRIALIVDEYGTSARLWDAEVGTQLGQPLQHEERIVGAAFSPDGSYLLTGSEDHTARLWDAKSGKPVGTALRHADSVSAVGFCGVGRTAVTACRDGSIRLWEVATCKPLVDPLRVDGGIASVASCLDDSVTAGAGNSWIWNIKTNEFPGDVKLIKVWAKARTGLELDSEGFVRRLSQIEWLTAKDEFDKYLIAQQWESAAKISWHDAGNHIGERVIVEGKIVLVGATERFWFLNFHENFKEHFKAVIPSSAFLRFGNDGMPSYREKNIQVFGEVIKFKGFPEIIVTDPNQIRIVKNAKGSG